MLPLLHGVSYSGYPDLREVWFGPKVALFTITGVHNNQDLIWRVKIEAYMGFWVHRGF